MYFTILQNNFLTKKISFNLCFFFFKFKFIRCVAYFYNQSECQIVGGSIHFPSHSFEECQNYGFGCRTKEFSTTGLYENLTETICASVGGEWVAYFQWEESVWVGGKIVKTEWTTREMINPNVISETLNFTEMAFYVSLPSKVNQITSLQNEVRKFQINIHLFNQTYLLHYRHFV
jgi:hypothetical protein